MVTVVPDDRSPRWFRARNMREIARVGAVVQAGRALEFADDVEAVWTCPDPKNQAHLDRLLAALRSELLEVAAQQAVMVDEIMAAQARPDLRLA